MKSKTQDNKKVRKPKTVRLTDKELVRFDKFIAKQLCYRDAEELLEISAPTRRSIERNGICSPATKKRILLKIAS